MKINPLLVALTWALVAPVAAGQPGLAGPLTPAGDSWDPVQYYEALQRARDVYDSGDFGEAAEEYTRLVEAYPDDGESWLRLWISRYYLEEYPAAAAALRRARSLGFGFPQNTAYYLAGAYALAGDEETALDWLEQAVEHDRFENRLRLRENPDFASLRDDPRFRRLAGYPSQEASSREGGWRSDIDFLISELRRLHPDYSRQPLPDSVLQAAEQLKRVVPERMDAEMVFEVQRLLALLGHSHNSVWHWVDAERFGLLMLPLSLYVFPEGIFVVDAEDRRFVGAEVLAFDGTPTAEALAAIAPVAMAETPMQVLWLGPDYLRMPQLLHWLGLIEQPDRVRLRLRHREGQEETAELEGVPVQRRQKLGAPDLPDVEPPLWLSRPDTPYWFTEVPGGGAAGDSVLYLQFNQVVSAEDEPLDAFALRLRHHLWERPRIRHLVLDLRRNNGGNTYLYPELVRTLVWFDAQEDHSLYVLIGRNTYSAAQNLVVDLERFTDAVFVGEPSGGTPNTHGDESHVVLPYSGLHLGLSAVYWQLSSPRDARLWVPPDIPAPLTADDYFSGRDPVLSAILSLINR